MVSLRSIPSYIPPSQGRDHHHFVPTVLSHEGYAWDQPVVGRARPPGSRVFVRLI